MGFPEDHLGAGTWRADPPFSPVTFKVRHLGARDHRAGFRVAGDDSRAITAGGGLSIRGHTKTVTAIGWDVTLEALIEFVEE